MREQIIRELADEIRDQISIRELSPSDEEVRLLVEERIFDHPALRDCGAEELKHIAESVFFSLRSDLDILQPYLDDPEVSEIMVNGRERIFVERRGAVERVDAAFTETSDLEEVIRRIASRVHREINERQPIVDARLADGSRVNAVYRNIALGGPVLTIRKFPATGFTMDDLIRFGTLTDECAAFLRRLVRAGYNCFISGGTSSGKTTFLNVLSGFIPADERVIVIEDSAELQLQGLKNLVRMECRAANLEGQGQITMSQLIRTSLRMRPDRIIVGEVRGGEVMDMVNAMNTGHDGSLSTGHGNSVRGMLRRLESMFLQAADFPIEAIRAQIIEGIDLIVHLGRLRDGRRLVLEVAELIGFEESGEFQLSPLFRYEPGRGLQRTGRELQRCEKLRLHGEEADGSDERG
ncbi:MAG: CpaF family protein [Anaerovoracaceae bacterium]